MTHAFERTELGGLSGKWGWFVVLGLVLLVFGFIALANLFTATVVSVYYIGLLMLLGGVVELAHAFQVKGWRNVLSWALSGVLYTIAGICAFINPVLASAVLTLLLAMALLVSGLLRIWAGFKTKPTTGWGWIVFGGTITALLGLVVAVGWPVNSLWMLGLFLAVDLIMQGWTLVLFGWGIKH
ncbi:HdeD family acid-resistance protein [Rhizobiaceae bacterium n13]|uniref:HdeD family acid-resistance protein n=1 Tax=Ferirhizobium litorale TaxID=2927786 RepID=A0AAE3QDR1_9HYPH|nr:HdeD family acid-resistance protein [Fererhizobium litorale]MDI7861354.1 HdeD family acid-resistance protein [Fererhizobium litorale]MDI7921501.1 HdeD family acid-resistance protein [Fererhizobium litorale]